MSSDSIYVQCGEAARTLLGDPSLRSRTEAAPPGIWTELDVLFLAARTNGGYTPDQMRLASREASQVMGLLYRTNHVVRFGPVEVPGIDLPDYVRIESKIAYASAGNGPKQIRTPNGVYPRLLSHEDPVGRQGRRHGAARDDLKPWADQNLLGPSSALTGEQREILRLNAENAALRARVEELEAELERASQAVTKDDLRDLRRVLSDMRES